MTKRWLFYLFGIALLENLLVAAFQHAPGYMDADYYFAGGMRLAQGQGFSELVLWNYLDDPAGLPHPSHVYWMPLTSLVAAMGMLASGSLSFAAGRIGFVLLAACVPPLTAALAYSLTNRRDLALTAGWLALFPGFYLSYFPTSDSFGLYMLGGGLFFLVLGSQRLWAVPTGGCAILGAALLGALAGGLHLGRADGLLAGPGGIGGLSLALEIRVRRLAGAAGFCRQLIRLSAGDGAVATTQPGAVRRAAGAGRQPRLVDQGVR
jgi:hypothetical protein